MKDSNKSGSRRDFFQDVTAGTAGLAVAAALSQLGVTTVSAAQDAKKAPPERASSPFFKNPPPWPKGTEGTKYDHLFSTKLKENTITDVVAGPQAYFRGDSDLPGHERRRRPGRPGGVDQDGVAGNTRGDIRGGSRDGGPFPGRPAPGLGYLRTGPVHRRRYAQCGADARVLRARVIGLFHATDYYTGLLFHAGTANALS